MLFCALPQAEKYSAQELTRAMESLLDCNFKLVSSGLDSALVLQQTLIRIVSFHFPRVNSASAFVS